MYSLSLKDRLILLPKASLRLRINLGLRNSAADSSQRMLNALEPGTVLPIHRHCSTSETVAILRGRAVQWLYDADGNVAEKVLLEVGGAIPAMSVEKGQWHRLECLESGTVILEMKDGAYEPIGPADILSM